jgi:hypothetical protein
VAGSASSPEARAASWARTRSQLGGRLLGEGDGGDAAHGLAPVGDQGDHPVDQRPGLAGAGAGLDEKGLVERGADALAGDGVGVLAHGVVAFSRASCISASVGASASWA